MGAGELEFDILAKSKIATLPYYKHCRFACRVVF